MSYWKRTTNKLRHGIKPKNWDTSLGGYFKGWANYSTGGWLNKHDYNYGQKNDVYFGGAKKDAREKEDFAKGQAALREVGIENDVKGVRAQFGLFDGDPNADPAHKELADIAHKSMTDAHDQYASAYKSYFNPQIDNQFNNATMRANWAGADRGNDGGSADAVRQRPIGEKYIAGRQRIAAGADAGVRGLQDSEQAARLRLEGQARNGLAPEYAVHDELQGLQGNFQHANSAITGETLGDVFGAGANLYNGYQNAYGATQGQRAGSRVNLYDGGDSSGGYYS